MTIITITVKKLVYHCLKVSNGLFTIIVERDIFLIVGFMANKIINGGVSIWHE